MTASPIPSSHKIVLENDQVTGDKRSPAAALIARFHPGPDPRIAGPDQTGRRLFDGPSS